MKLQTHAASANSSLRQAYLALIKRSVMGYLSHGNGKSFESYSPWSCYDRKRGRWLVEKASRPMTVLSAGQLDLIERSILDLDARQVDGDFIEAGVWRGGAVILMLALLKAVGIQGRQVLAADSFAGIPKNHTFRHDPVDLWEDRWEASLEEVRSNIERFGLLDGTVQFIPGDFRVSLSSLAGRRFALMRLDSDAHDSVTASLEHLYPLLSVGGIVIIDDWHLIGCRIAVDSFRRRLGLTEPIVEEAGNGYWIKGCSP